MAALHITARPKKPTELDKACGLNSINYYYKGENIGHSASIGASITIGNDLKTNYEKIKNQHNDTETIH